MSVHRDDSDGVAVHRWDTHPKSGWDEFQAARRRHLAILQLQTDLDRTDLAVDTAGTTEPAGR